MMKTKQKISGCFRNLDHATAFAKKQAINALEILSLILSNPLQAQQRLPDT